MSKTDSERIAEDREEDEALIALAAFRIIASAQGESVKEDDVARWVRHVQDAVFKMTLVELVLSGVAFVHWDGNEFAFAAGASIGTENADRAWRDYQSLVDDGVLRPSVTRSDCPAEICEPGKGA